MSANVLAQGICSGAQDVGVVFARKVRTLGSSPGCVITMILPGVRLSGIVADWRALCARVISCRGAHSFAGQQQGNHNDSGQICIKPNQLAC